MLVVVLVLLIVVVLVVNSVAGCGGFGGLGCCSDVCCSFSVWGRGLITWPVLT